MNIAIVGTGYVGLVTGTCFSEMGINVTCVDVDKVKIDNLNRGIVPIYEQELDELIKKNSAAGRLKFITSLADVIDDVDIVFSAVGTPSDEDGSADLKYVLEVARTVGATMNSYKLIVTKSTVPVGTSIKVKVVIQEELNKRGLDIPFDVASNPEFLKEGLAVSDFMNPERVVVGVESEIAKKLFEKLYRPLCINNSKLIFMDVPSAEMTKYASNAMLATRISFMNDVASLCEKIGADITMVRRGMGSDSRIGNKFLYAGCGYGGSCFPKDVKALIHTAKDNGLRMKVIEAVEQVNDNQKKVLFKKLVVQFGSEDALKGKTIAIWGLSFKPDTDDMREAPSIVLIKQLLAAGASVKAYDPISIKTAKHEIGEIITYTNSMNSAVENADALVLVTEWKEFRSPTWNSIKKLMRGNVVIDGRNIYDREEIEESGFIYSCIGR